jgi:hypothetical protein
MLSPATLNPQADVEAASASAYTARELFTLMVILYNGSPYFAV